MCSQATLLALFLAVALPAQIDRYQLIDFGTLGGPTSRAYQSNLDGAVAGYSVDGGGVTMAALWLPRPMYGLPAGLNGLGLPAGATYSRGYSVNIHGEVLGYCDAPNGNTVIALWLPAGRLGYPAGWNTIPGFGGDIARARYNLRDDLTFVGEANRVPGGPVQALLHVVTPQHWGMLPGLHDLSSSYPGIEWASLRGINAAGWAVGRALRVGDTYPGTALWIPGFGWSFLDAPSGYGGYGSAINESGTVAGSRTPYHGLFDGYRGIGPNRVILPRLIPAPGDVWVRHINDRDEVVGLSRDNAYQPQVVRATTWHTTANGEMPVDLNSLTSNAGGWLLRRPFGVANNGVITGYGDYLGSERGFILVPDTFDAVFAPAMPAPGAYVHADITYATPSEAVLLICEEIQGLPILAILTVGGVDALGAGVVTMGVPVPPGLAGITIKVRAATWDALRRQIIYSETQVLTFQ